MKECHRIFFPVFFYFLFQFHPDHTPCYYWHLCQWPYYVWKLQHIYPPVVLLLCEVFDVHVYILGNYIFHFIWLNLTSHGLVRGVFTKFLHFFIPLNTFIFIFSIFMLFIYLLVGFYLFVYLFIYVMLQKSMEHSKLWILSRPNL